MLPTPPHTPTPHLRMDDWEEGIESGALVDGDEEYAAGGRGRRSGRSGAGARGRTGGSGGGGVGGGVGGGEGSQEARRAERLARNRESARQSRRRRKEYLEHLEDRVAELTVRVDAARQRHMEAAMHVLAAQRSALVARAGRGVESGEGGEEGAREALRVLRARYGVGAAEKRAAVHYHVESLLRALAPPHVRLVLWLAQQDAEGARAAPAGVLWGLLCAELGLSSDQSARLEGKLRAVREGRLVASSVQRLTGTIAAMRGLQTSLLDVGREADRLGHAVLDVLTPQQAVRYLAWYDANRARVAHAMAPAAARTASK
jgi:bZIP transcription factor